MGVNTERRGDGIEASGGCGFIHCWIFTHGMSLVALSVERVLAINCICSNQLSRTNFLQHDFPKASGLAKVLSPHSPVTKFMPTA